MSLDRIEKEIHRKEQEERTRENTGVFRINTQQLTNDLASSIKAFEEEQQKGNASMIDAMLRAALKRMLVRGVLLVLVGAGAITTSAITFLRSNPGPEVEEARETRQTVEAASSGIDQRVAELEKLHKKLDTKVNEIDSTMSNGFDRIEAKLDSMAAPPVPQRSRREK